MGGKISWSSQVLRRVAVLIEQGAVRGTVKNKQEAQELYLGMFHGKGVRNADDFNSTSAKDFFQRFNVEQGGTILENYYHWDDIFEFRKFDSWAFTRNIDGVPTTITRSLTQSEITQIRQMLNISESSHRITSEGAYVLKNHDPFTDADSFVSHLQIHFRATPDGANGIFEGRIYKIFFK